MAVIASRIYHASSRGTEATGDTTYDGSAETETSNFASVMTPLFFTSDAWFIKPTTTRPIVSTVPSVASSAVSSGSSNTNFDHFHRDSETISFIQQKESLFTIPSHEFESRLNDVTSSMFQSVGSAGSVDQSPSNITGYTTEADHYGWDNKDAYYSEVVGNDAQLPTNVSVPTDSSSTTKKGVNNTNKRTWIPKILNRIKAGRKSNERSERRKPADSLDKVIPDETSEVTEAVSIGSEPGCTNTANTNSTRQATNVPHPEIPNATPNKSQPVGQSLMSALAFKKKGDMTLPKESLSDSFTDDAYYASQGFEIVYDKKLYNKPSTRKKKNTTPFFRRWMPRKNGGQKDNLGDSPTLTLVFSKISEGSDEGSHKDEKHNCSVASDTSRNKSIRNNKNRTRNDDDGTVGKGSIEFYGRGQQDDDSSTKRQQSAKFSQKNKSNNDNNDNNDSSSSVQNTVQQCCKAIVGNYEPKAPLARRHANYKSKYEVDEKYKKSKLAKQTEKSKEKITAKQSDRGRKGFAAALAARQRDAFSDTIEDIIAKNGRDDNSNSRKRSDRTREWELEDERRMLEAMNDVVQKRLHAIDKLEDNHQDTDSFLSGTDSFLSSSRLQRRDSYTTWGLDSFICGEVFAPAQ